MKQFDVLIVGDFPPATHTGISMVNALVRDVLTEHNKRVCIIDESAWIYKGIKRAIHYIVGSHLTLVKVLWKSKTKYIYLNIPLSFAGQIRLLIACLIVKIFSRRSNLIGHIHRGDIKQWVDKSFINKFILGLNLIFFNRVVILSKKFENDLLSYYPKINTIVIPNTSLLEGFNRKNYNLNNNNFVCISNIIKTKGLGDIVNAFSNIRLKNFHLTIIGNIYDRDFFNELIAYNSSNIEFIVNSNRQKVSEQLINSDCLILPSWNEGQPLVVLEAMSLGVPIIATNVGDIPNMVGNDYPFLYEPHNPAMLIEKVILFSNYEKKAELSEQLLLRYKLNYSRNIFVKNILELFK
ncbi:MAG TPA: glycosyltransferase family 4 protein [Ignavibacteriales bacterium]|nr:glycosyltransferase family 4 protein [Ignavibacteriales bacterium]